MHRLTEDQSLQFLEAWNSSRDHRERIYITYDSTNKRSCNIYEYGVYGITVKSKLYETDKTERYFHIFHSIDKESAERSEIEYKLNKLGLYLEAHKNKHLSHSKQLLEYFWLEYYDERTGKAITSFDEKSMEYARFLTATEKASVIENEIDLAGYFCIITSEKMTAKEAITLYKNRDASEKLFRGDKSYMGNKSMRAHHNESVDSKIFIEFIALIIRNKIYTSLKDEMVHIRKKPNYMTVPAAIKELEKIEMIRHPDGTYGLYSGATSTQKSILKVFGIDTNHLKHLVTKLSVVLRETEGGNQ